jgi:hypothetical protein
VISASIKGGTEIFLLRVWLQMSFSRVATEKKIPSRWISIVIYASKEVSCGLQVIFFIQVE